MSDKIAALEPRQLWKHFYSLTQIPRVSKNEEKVRGFIKKFSEGLGLETLVDEVGNLVVRKPAAPGMEKGKTVCLQSHMDMVGQKNKGVKHDFSRDPIDAYIDGEWVTAAGTTLGADNGIGAAAAMGVLETQNISHGPIETLFTVDEETGFTGAFGLKPGILKADILINLDSEHEGHLYKGSAGGRMTRATFRYSEEEVPGNSKAFEVRLTGMRGGHSGLDIHMGWGNAVKILNRYLCHAVRSLELGVASINAGSIMSAIPSEGFAVVTVPAKNAAAFRKGVKEYEQAVKNELSPAEPDAKFEAVPTKMPRKVMDKFSLDNLVKAVCECPNGVMRMSREVDGLVDTSTNLGVLKSQKGKIDIITFQRSFDNSYMKDLSTRISRILEWTGAAEVTHKFLFPAWLPENESLVLKEMQRVYKDLFAKEAKVKRVHAGLECGVFKSVYPHLDIVSIGPSIYFAHTPEEKVNIGTVKDFWDFLVETLKHVGKR